MINRSCAKDCVFVTLSDQFQLTQALQNRMKPIQLDKRVFKINNVLDAFKLHL